MESSTLHIGDRQSLVSVVPYLLGFHPRESFVMLVMRGDRLVLTARLDLPAADAGIQLAVTLRRIATANGGDSVVLIVFTARDDYPAAWLLCSCVDAMTSAVSEGDGHGEVQIRDALVVEADRWYSAFIDTDRACPPQGPETAPSADRSGSCDPASAAAVSAIARGMVALPSRDEVRSLATPSTDRASQPFGATLIRVAAQWPDESSRRVRMLHLLTVPHPLVTPEIRRQLAVLAGTVAGRAAVLQGLSTANAQALVGLWSSVVRQTPTQWATGALGMLGAAAWVSGQGALQLICAEQILQLDPGDQLATDLLDLNEQMVPPSQWDPSAPWVRRGRIEIVGGGDSLQR